VKDLQHMNIWKVAPQSRRTFVLEMVPDDAMSIWPTLCSPKDIECSTARFAEPSGW